MNKADVIAILKEIGTLLELVGENPFKTRAYHNAARTLEIQPEEIENLIKSELLAKLPGFGEALTEKVTTLVTTGHLKYLDDLRKKVPAGLLEMIRIPGFGPKRARAVFKKLKIDTVSKLEKACREGKIAKLPGFGAKSEKNILEGIGHLKEYSGRYLYPVALEVAEYLIGEVRGFPKVKRAEIGGSLRRHRETIKDIDILASSSDPKSVIDLFAKLPEVESIIAKGDTKCSVRIVENGIQADLRVVKEDEFPFALHYFTGNAEHNTQIRQRAKDRGMKLNEYGLFKGKKKIPCNDETAIFKKLGLHYIQPELREATGEIGLAEKGELPQLIEEKDIKGIFHVHTNWSDGKATLEEMVAGAEALGLSYIGIAEHSQSVAYAGGLKPEQLEAEKKMIDRIQEKHKIRIFWGAEADILPDGSLDYPDKVLEQFDFVVAAIHSAFTTPEEEMTGRILKGIKNKYATMFAHPTGRLLLQREPYAVDMKRVIDAASDYGKVLELNCHPSRFDLDWRLGPYTKKKGVKVSINPDAHSVAGIAYYRHGVGIARKAWFTKDDVITTMSVAAMERFLSAYRVQTQSRQRSRPGGRR